MKYGIYFRKAHQKLFRLQTIMLEKEGVEKFADILASSFHPVEYVIVEIADNKPIYDKINEIEMRFEYPTI